MKFSEVVEQVLVMLQRQGRISYRALKREFDLDNEYIEDLKEEIIKAKRLATDEDGAVLVWIGNNSLESRVQSLESEGQGRASTVQALDPRHQTLDAAAERRQLTVLFCDLVGSTALSAQLDPEELREVVRQYQQTCAEVIQRYDGHIAQYLGDGLLVYFGYPVAHEDDAARAVRAGLDSIQALQRFSVPSPVPTGEGQLHVRIGIHTGLVVIGEIGSSEKREMLALGETPNLAARIQGQANPDEVVISAATYRLVEGLFESEDRGQPELKGVPTPLTLYRVVKAEEVQSRFEVVVRKGLTPLIGREHEYGLLQERWARVKEGEGQVVLLSGESGIGKSRLVEALKESIEHEGASCLELRCSPYAQNSALAPVIEHLQRVSQFQQSDSPEEKLRKLLVGATSRSPLQTEVVSLFAALLSLPQPEGYPPLTLSPQKQREKTHEALVAWLCAEAKQQTVMYAWEDLHWADPSTLELLALFLAQVPTTRLLAVLTFRPEFSPPWGSHSYLSQLTLSRLGRSHVETMVEKVTGDKALPKEVVQQIVIKTDGVPLFVEELTKTVVESRESIGSRGRLDPSAISLGIPATLQDALMARLDRLGPAKEIAQLGATLGREFNYDLLQAISSLNTETLQQGLKQLVESELVYQSGLPPQARYLFKHVLVQDTAYQSLLKSRRQQLHHQVAQVLVEQFPQTVETQPELAAHHYTEAGLVEQAIPYWQKAGERATQRSAYVEAVAHLTKGLELLKPLPDTPERAQQELTLHLALGAALYPVKGYTAPEVEKTYIRARELCQQLGDIAQLVPVLGRLVLLYQFRGEVRTARELAEEMLRLAQSIQDPYLLSLAHARLGHSLYMLGELTSARTHAEQGIAMYDSQTHPRPAVDTSKPRLDCLFFASWTLWRLGYPEQGLKRIYEAVTEARGLSLPFTLAAILGNAAIFHLLRREEQLARERTEEGMTLATEQGFPYLLSVGAMVRGWTLAEQGQVEEGIAQMRQSRMSFIAPYVLAEAYAKVGQVAEGLTVLAEALAFVDKTGMHVSEAELYRVKGTLTLQLETRGWRLDTTPASLQASSLKPLVSQAVAQEAEGYFLKAIEISRRQQAKSLELRASTNLARLWQQQGNKAEAHKLLSDVYNWFTEGFDTKDLQEAKALIEELT